MLKKRKLSSAIAMVLTASVGVTGLTLLTGCDPLSEETARTGGTATRVSNPKGNVTGLVVDTNGNPLADVTVRTYGKTVKTDAGGVYKFGNIGAVDVTGADGAVNGNALLISVEAPTGHLGATVEVRPEAAIDGSPGDEVRQNTVSFFIDGFIAQADTAVLPALNSTVKGVLRDANTGEHLDGVSISLDLESVGSDCAHPSEPWPDEGSASYQTLTYNATSGTGGAFSIANVPSDSCMRFVLEDYTVSGSGDVVTADEVEVVNVGNLDVNPILAEDNTHPWVTSVDQVVDQGGNPGRLNDDAADTLVINFSEALDQLVDSNSVVVLDFSTDTYITLTSATLATDGRSLTVVAAAAFTAGSEIRVFLLKDDFRDWELNDLTAGSDVAYDSNFTTTPGTQYVRLDFDVFIEANLNATATTDLAQEAVDTTGITEHEVDLASVTFNDNDDFDDAGTGEIQQMNSDDDQAAVSATSAAIDAKERLDALLAQVSPGLTVDADVARVSFTPTNATSYALTVERNGSFANLNAPGEAIDFPATTGVATEVYSTPAGEAANSLLTMTADNSGDPIVMLIDNARVGDTVTITPLDDFLVEGTETTLVIADNVAPRPVLQRSYGIGGSAERIGDIHFGDGGELAHGAAGTVGIPLMHITPQLLDNIDEDGNDIQATLVLGDTWLPSDGTLEHELFDNNNPAALTAPDGGTAFLPATNVYDAAAIAAMIADAGRRVGAAMSEDVASTGTNPAFTGTTVLTNWLVQNDTVINDLDSGLLDPITTIADVDLMTFDAASVIDLANNDHDQVMNFAGVITDTAGNAGDAVNGLIQVADSMPPFMLSMVYNGNSIEVTFNEPVVLDLAVDTIPFAGATLGLTNATMVGNVLTILPEDNTGGAAEGTWIDSHDTVADPLDGFPTAVGIGFQVPRTAFNLARYDETAAIPGIVYQAAIDNDLLIPGGNAGGHFAMNYNTVEDVHANDWATNAAFIPVPLMAATDAVGDIESSPGGAPTIAQLAAIGGVTVSYTFSQPLDFDNVFNGCAGGTVAEITGDFTLTAPGVVSCWTIQGAAVTSTGASYNGATRVLTVNLQLAGTTAADAIQFLANGGNAQSEYDGAGDEPVLDILVLP